jgi:TusA-related sulfurtransferase
MRRTTALIVLVLGGAAYADQARDMSGKQEQKMLQCPSSVRGATTSVVDLKDGVEVTVTAPDPATQEEIRRRARHQERIAMQSARGVIEHTGEGTGSGKFGYCPGMLQETRVSAEDVPGGTKLTVRADRPQQVHKLQKTTQKRAEALRVHQ